MKFSYLKKLKPRSGLITRLAALPMAALLSPALLFAMAATYITIGRPIFITQPRYGKNKRIFTIYKIRTMTDERDANGQLLPDDARRTKIGSLLRATTIDEIPQLLNVLKGDMAIIGPRPMEEDVSHVPGWDKRYEVLPGLTGLTQVNTRPDNFLTDEEKRALDLLYVRMKKRGGWPLLKLDAQILAHTIYVMFTANHAPMGGAVRPRNGKGNGKSNGNGHAHRDPDPK
ncbi:MAG: sugar transferase [Alphaproteobacteria bacterium]|nr:sugar transferase [Alphaproteobacteria bacterium]